MDFNPNSMDSQFASLRTLMESQDESKTQRLDRLDALLEQLFTIANETRVRVVQNDGRLEAHGEALNEIKAQTQRTNGRVTANEKEIESLKRVSAKRAGWWAGAAAACGLFAQAFFHFVKF